jgi:hypothetical protein
MLKNAGTVEWQASSNGSLIGAMLVTGSRTATFALNLQARRFRNTGRGIVG